MPLCSHTFDVDAAPEAVWEALTDTAHYADWNTRLVAVSAPFVVGRPVTLTYAKGAPGVPHVFDVDVDVVQTNAHLQWSGGVRGVLAATHFFKLSPQPHGTTVEHGERFVGVLAPVVWPVLGRVVRRNHQQFNACLQARFAPHAA